jgi:hypothetical protein
MQVQIYDMPYNVIKHYQLTNIATPDRYVYCETQIGNYSLPQAGIIAQQLLKKQLQKHGYHKSATTPGLWKHNTGPISSSLVVDNFRVNFVEKENAQHLIDTV